MMTDASEGSAATLLALYGTDAPADPLHRHSIGRLAFDMVGGKLGGVFFDGVEVLRGIQYLVRDRDWGTLSPSLHDLRVDHSADEIVIGYRALCAWPDGSRLEFAAQVIAQSRSLEFHVQARAIDAIIVNRLGFCILHPADLAGARLRVEHGDGSTGESRFPVLIDPWQPFTDIQSLTHRSNGLTVAVRLDGDAFEMEDQRNWSDASYKTYVRPLAKPWPYVLPAGTVDRQAVRVELSGQALVKPPAEFDVIEVHIGEPIGALPRIGLVVTPAEAEAEACLAHRDALQDVGVQDLLLSFEPHAGHGRADMEALAAAVRGLPHRKTLECVIAADRDLDAELSEVAAWVAGAGLGLDAVAVYPAPDLQSTPPGSAWPDCPPLADFYAAARRAFPGLVLGGGMYSYFTELNRKRPPLEPLDFLSHATCPIVHAADDVSVMQSLQALPHIVRSARAIIGALPYRLGPVTIGMRQNPYGSRTMPNPDRVRLPMATVDPRQDGEFAAAWTIGVAAATEEGGLDTLTLGALTGPLGVIGPQGRRPVFSAVAALARLAGRERRACSSAFPSRVAAVASDSAVVVANLTAEQQRIQLPDTQVVLEPFAIRTVRYG